jgi:uncharacterized protein YecE (DUF72 family)
MTLWIGTSGWQYRDWRGPFYPPGLPTSSWLPRYAEDFATAELNASFYRLPARATFAAWRERTPPGFLMAVKASRYLTHIRRLRDPAEPVARLMDRATALGDRLGPVLVQLPPTLQADPGLLAATLAQFPAGVRVAVEPRHASWWTDDTRRVLERAGAALCLADRDAAWITPRWRTADWGYVRLHWGAGTPAPCYPRAVLAERLEELAATWGPAEDVVVYFNNDPLACALRDARELGLLAAARGLPATRVPAAEVPLTERPQLTEEPPPGSA